MNPFSEKPMDPEHFLTNWKDMYPKAYDKNATDPYTKTRIILMNGTEYEANWFSHCFMRHTDDVALRQSLGLCRFLEKQQQQKLSMLKPVDETVLETTIAYEQLAVDLTAELAKREKDFYVKKALDFALLEDFDHLYRYADLLEEDEGIHAEQLVGGYTEIMPGRPTVAHHRHPVDNVKRNITGRNSDKQTVLDTMIITAAEQQTMNYYMNQSGFYKNDKGRKLYEEICLVEEEHVTQYGSLIDSTAGWFEMMLWHEYVECYLYWSCYETETDARIKKIWEEFLATEIAHLHAAEKLLKKYEKKDHSAVIGDGTFPAPISLHENIEYVRGILRDTAQFTGVETDYKNISELKPDGRYFRYQKTVNSPISAVPSHSVIKDYIEKNGTDYRFETAENPIKALRSRKKDNVTVGVDPTAAESTGFKPNK